MLAWLLGAAWYALGAFLLLACLAAILEILIEAACSPEVIDHNIHPIPTAHESRVIPDEEHWDDPR